MATLNQDKFLSELQSETTAIIAYAEKLSQLPAQVLKTSPRENQWSVTECLEHMNLATELYLNQIEPKMKTHLKESSSADFKRGFFAGYSTKSLKPSGDGQIKNKMKTLNVFKPKSDADANVFVVLDDFIANQNRILKLIDGLKGKNLRSFKVTTALGKILKFYVGEALEFAIAHNQRHILQIKRILEQVKSPVYS